MWVCILEVFDQSLDTMGGLLPVKKQSYMGWLKLSYEEGEFIEVTGYCIRWCFIYGVVENFSFYVVMSKIITEAKSPHGNVNKKGAVGVDYQKTFLHAGRYMKS